MNVSLFVCLQEETTDPILKIISQMKATIFLSTKSYVGWYWYAFRSHTAVS